MRSKSIKNNSGFALLFSVLLSSLLLTIGLSIFSIALKELAISTATRQSIHAFYAADSGRECALYWDTKGGQIPTPANNQVTGTISCGEKVNLSLNNVNPNGTKTTINNGGSGIFVRDSTGGDYANFKVEILKTQVNSSSDILTTVTSYGYDSANDDRVERSIQQTY